MERILLILSCVPYFLASGYTLYALIKRREQPNRFNLVSITTGFALHTGFLFFRGENIGHCPLSNLFETLVFITWGLVLNYLLVGPVFRVSLLGAFMAPLVLAIHLVALILPGIDVPRVVPVSGMMLEMHAALSLLAYSTLGLSAVAALMFLVEHRALKSRNVKLFLFSMPALGKLERVSFRIGIFGFILLTVGLVAGFLVPDVRGGDMVKVVWSLSVWVVYSVMLVGRMISRISPARFAWVNLGSYATVLLTFWMINSASQLHRFGV